MRWPVCLVTCARGQGPAADCLERDWEDFVTVYDFPQEHWIHLRASHPIESIPCVRLRTDASKRLRVPVSLPRFSGRMAATRRQGRLGLHTSSRTRWG